MKKKKLIIAVVVAVLVLALLCVFWFVIRPGIVVESGNCGDNLEWSLNAAGVLTVSGTGEMYDYELIETNDVAKYKITSPWYPHYEDIHKIVIEDGVTYIGSCAFALCRASDAYISDSVTGFGENAFYFCAKVRNGFRLFSKERTIKIDPVVLHASAGSITQTYVEEANDKLDVIATAFWELRFKEVKKPKEE